MDELIATTSAPGKLFLFGEYGVLAGGWSVLTAVDRRVRARRHAAANGYELRGATVDNPLALPGAVVDHGPPAASVTPAHLSTDVGDLFDADSGQKYGLGSSAASAVALMAGCLVDRDARAIDQTSRRVIFERAFAAHRALQDGRGSGADVAASAFGACLGYRLRRPVAPFAPIAEARAEDRMIEPSFRTDQVDLVENLSLPDSLNVAALWLGRPARSTHFVRRCEQAFANDAAHFQQALGRTSRAARRALAAIDCDDADALVAAARRADRALDELGEVISAPIITPAHRQLRDYADRHEIAVKPSGAGGGDFSLAFGRDDAAWDAFMADLPAGIRHVPVAFEADGVRRHPTAPDRV